MTEFHVDVIKVGKLEKHPNADTLSITHIHGGYPCIVKTGTFSEGDIAVYVPIDTTLPNSELFAFLKESDRRRLRAKKLRGIFSMGLLVPATPGMQPGDDVAEQLGITRYEPIEQLSTGGDCEAPPGGWQFITYTDIEPLRRHGGVLKPGEPVVITEKLHGANARFVHDGQRLWAGSRTQIKKDAPESVWWKAARQSGLADKLASEPFKIFFGEVFGRVQDLNYGIKNGVAFRAFDVFDIKAGLYLSTDDMLRLCATLDIDTVPVMHHGPWDPSRIEEWSEGKSILYHGHVREGFVVKPVKERWDDAVGRVILKLHGQGYLLR